MNAGSKHVSSTSTNSFGSSARNILADMDYTDYMPESSPSFTVVIKGLVEQAIWKYTSVFLAQPFEVAKTVLQAQAGSQAQKSIAKDKVADDIRRRPGSYRRDSFEMFSDDDSDPDSPSYFTSSAPLAHTPTRRSRTRQRHGSSEPDGVPRVHTPQQPPSKPPPSTHTLDLKSSSSVSAVLSSLWAAEGSWGIWKGTNSTYIHSILLNTITSFVRSFFSAFLALPDPGLSFTAAPSLSYAGGLDILSSPLPSASLAVAVSAAGLAGMILAPLDMARTMLILTPSTHPPRSILATLKTLPSWTLPFSIAPAAMLHSTIPTLISASTPLFLRSKLGIDPVLTPNMYSIATFVGQAFELVVKLPIETVLRRGQMDVARSTSKGKEMQTIVEVGPYRGLFGTMHSIVYEEGERGPPVELVKGKIEAPAMQVARVALDRKGSKGQGFAGLWRGWRVGTWGLMGVWGAATWGGVGGKGGEF
ncbi:MAG: mitochondrial fusion and transport protein ugo1 [Alectoria sarmentosa]|nr:MAG: mitochondrial fusion and transport protein ugo1 [Alectoria sarmentosa]